MYPHPCFYDLSSFTICHPDGVAAEEIGDEPGRHGRDNAIASMSGAIVTKATAARRLPRL
jgi:hypothetical protein